MQHLLQKGYTMEVQDAISKVLTSLSNDPSLQQSMQENPEAAIKSIVGDDLTPQQLTNFTRGTASLFKGDDTTKSLMSLLGGSNSGSNIDGLSKILLLVGGVSLLKKLLKQSSASSNSMSSLTQMLGNQQGVSSLTNLIGKKEDEIPDLTDMLGMLGGVQQQSNSGAGGILGMLGKLIK